MIDSTPNISATPMMESKPRPSSDDDGFGFDDFLDIINPLQHVPIIGTIYRELTGDHIETPARLAGGALFGGLFGFLGSLGAVAFEHVTGESVDHTLASLFEGGRGTDPYRARQAYASAQALTD